MMVDLDLDPETAQADLEVLLAEAALACMHCLDCGRSADHADEPCITIHAASFTILAHHTFELLRAQVEYLFFQLPRLYDAAMAT